MFLTLSATSPNASELEQARPQTSGEEELQLQLALAMSREAAEQVRLQPMKITTRRGLKQINIRMTSNSTAVMITCIENTIVLLIKLLNIYVSNLGQVIS